MNCEMNCKRYGREWLVFGFHPMDVCVAHLREIQNDEQAKKLSFEMDMEDNLRKLYLANAHGGAAGDQEVMKAFVRRLSELQDLLTARCVELRTLAFERETVEDNPYWKSKVT